LMHSSTQPSKVPVTSVVWKKLPFRSNSNRLFSLQSKRMCPNRRILFCFSYVLFRDLMMAGACPYGSLSPLCVLKYVEPFNRSISHII
jgi:hypothetical protein